MPWRARDYRYGWSGKEYRKHLKLRKQKRDSVMRYRARKKKQGYRLAWVKTPPQYSSTYPKLKMKTPKRKKLKKMRISEG